MESRRRTFCLSSAVRNLLILPTKDMLANAASHLRNKAKEKSKGLVILYEDMEACQGYADIQVMWEMVHSASSSAPPNLHNNRSSKSRLICWKLCFQSV